MDNLEFMQVIKRPARAYTAALRFSGVVHDIRECGTGVGESEGKTGSGLRSAVCRWFKLAVVISFFYVNMFSVLVPRFSTWGL